MRTRLNWFQEFYPTQSGKKQIEMHSIFSTRSIPAALRKSLAGIELQGGLGDTWSAVCAAARSLSTRKEAITLVVERAACPEPCAAT